MNKYLFIFSLLILLNACDSGSEKYEPFVGSYNEGVIITVFPEDKDGNNLLDATTPGYFTENEISVNYQHSSFGKLRPQIQSGFLISETDKGLVLKIYPELPNAYNVPHKEGDSQHETYTYIRFRDGAKHVIKAEFRVTLGSVDVVGVYGNSSCFLMKIYYDNILKWERDDVHADPVLLLKGPEL